MVAMSFNRFEHHIGICRGGPKAGEWVDYFERTMWVFVFPQVTATGAYRWDGEPGQEGVWTWYPCVPDASQPYRGRS